MTVIGRDAGPERLETSTLRRVGEESRERGEDEDRGRGRKKVKANKTREMGRE